MAKWDGLHDRFKIMNEYTGKKDSEVIRIEATKLYKKNHFAEGRILDAMALVLKKLEKLEERFEEKEKSNEK